MSLDILDHKEKGPLKGPNVLVELASSWTPRPRVAREGWAWVGGLLGLGLLAGSLSRLKEGGRLSGFLRVIGLALSGAGLMTAYAYRDPQREPLGTASDYVYSPADGMILSVQKVEDEPLFLNGPAYRIEITSHILDVPIQRSPLPAQVRYIHQNTGEGAKLGLETPTGQPLLLTFQLNPHTRFGLPFPLAPERVIFIRPQVGQSLKTVEEIGVRGFGTPLLTTLYLPIKDMDILCRHGQHVQAGMTVLGRIQPA